MFRPNDSHRQAGMFAFSVALTSDQHKALKETPEYAFYELVFSRIDEQPFAALYSEEKSRPNAPVNAQVGAIILLQYRNWSVAELVGAIEFDLRIRVALGLSDWNKTPFCPATYFNFQNRLYDHYLKTGENLLESLFDHLTKEQLKELGLKTNIQRADSFFAAANICSYSRLQLLVEVLLRLHRSLSETDQKTWADLFAPYVKYASSGQYIYRQKHGDVAAQMQAIGQVYHRLHQGLAAAYGQTEIYKILDRVYTEHFTVADRKIEVIPAENLSGSVLQSPDDPEATYRKKGKRASQGQVIHVAETAHPDNDLQLITDVVVAGNVTDDSVILNERLDKMAAKTPDLDELHTDGGYGSEPNDVKMADLEIKHIQTAIKGRTAAVPLVIEQVEVTVANSPDPQPAPADLSAPETASLATDQTAAIDFSSAPADPSDAIVAADATTPTPADPSDAIVADAASSAPADPSDPIVAADATTPTPADPSDPIVAANAASPAPDSSDQAAAAVYQVSCPTQKVLAVPTPTRFKAIFDEQVCRTCPLAALCSLKPELRQPVFYFAHEDFLRSQRHQALQLLPLERQTLRPNVEATVREFDRRLTDGKLKVRGQFATARFAFGAAIGINFGRIFRHQKARAAELLKTGTDSCAQN